MIIAYSSALDLFLKKIVYAWWFRRGMVVCLYFRLMCMTRRQNKWCQRNESYYIFHLLRIKRKSLTLFLFSNNFFFRLLILFFLRCFIIHIYGYRLGYIQFFSFSLKRKFLVSTKNEAGNVINSTFVLISIPLVLPFAIRMVLIHIHIYNNNMVYTHFFSRYILYIKVLVLYIYVYSGC